MEKAKPFMFIRQKVVKLLRALSYPRDDKILNLLKFARPQEVDNGMANISGQILNFCQECQHLNSSVVQLKDTLPSE